MRQHVPARPIPDLTPQEAERFWSHINIRDDASCWNWESGKSNGYGIFNFRNAGWIAQRIAFYVHFGINPGKYCVLHECDNPPCCNPRHLFIGTRTDNNRDKANKKRCTPLSGTKNTHAKLTDTQVKEIRALKGAPCKPIAKLYGISKCTVWDIQANRTWKHLLP